jgi:hypothetical protein
VGFEEKNPDVLQNIEFAIVKVSRENRGLSDYDVMRALDALIGHYRAESRGHVQKKIALEEQETDVFEGVRAVCELRMGRSEMPDGVPQVQGFEKSLDEVLDCLRKLRKSVEKWNKRYGPHGYLNFVSEYV